MITIMAMMMVRVMLMDYDDVADDDEGVLRDN
jgi:hypothetical protein